MYRKTANTDRVTLEYIDAKFDRYEERWRQDRIESEARLAADRKEAEARQQATEARLAAERKESEARLERERKESEARLERERKESEARLEREFRESRSTRRWLIATFGSVVGLIIAFAVLVLTLSSNGYLQFMGGI